MPMGLTSTQFLTYSDISVSDCDLIDDAFGLKSEFNDVLCFLGSAETEVPEKVMCSLLARISEKENEKATG
jgi:hypothetical protein